jgi:SAM-dependent methyltransferase
MTPPSDRPSEGGFDARFVELLANVEDRHFWFRARAQLIAGLVRDVAPTLPTGFRVLEVGCGTGSVLSKVSEVCRGHLAVGVDAVFEGLVHARRRSGNAARVLQGDARRPPFRDDVRFALVGLFDVIEHIPDDRSALEAAHGLMPPGGILLVTVPASPALWSGFDEAARHCRRYTEPALRAVLEEAGFHIDFISPFMTSLYPLVWVGRRAVRYGGHAAGRRQLSSDFRVVPVVNALLAAVLRLESAWVSRRRRLPFGVSLVAQARRM